MNQCFVTFILIVALVAVSGCAPGRASDPFEQWIDREEVETRTDSLQYVNAEVPARPVLELPETASVDDIVALALENNPGIRVAEERVRRIANRYPQVTSFDDPMLSVVPFGEMAETASGQVGAMSSLSQRLPFPGKLATRGRIVEQQVAEAIQILNEVRLNVAADTRLAWWSHYYAARAIEVTERNRVLVAQFKDVADAKFRAGTSAQEDVLRASVELHTLDSELVELRQRRVSAQAMLNRLLDRTINAVIPIPPVRPIEEVEGDLLSLLAQANEIHPALQRVRERIERFREQQELAELNRWPDLTVSVNYNLVKDSGLSGVANGDDQWWFGFGINLPIWTQRLDAAEREALRGRLENIAKLSDESNRIHFHVQDALAKVESQQKQTFIFRDVIIPEARQTVDASLASYRAGRVEFLTLIDNWRKLLVFELTYHNHLTQLERAFAELQRAVGRDIARSSDPTTETTPENQP